MVKKERTRAEIGSSSRLKGHNFERKVVKLLKAEFPQYEQVLRRANQTFQAGLPDVTGLPGWWIECQASANPDPIGKLQQAINDSERYKRNRWGISTSESAMIPIAVCQKTHAKTINCYMTLSQFVFVTTGKFPDFRNRSQEELLDVAVVSFTFETWIWIVKLGHAEGGQIEVDEESEE